MLDLDELSKTLPYGGPNASKHDYLLRYRVALFP